MARKERSHGFQLAHDLATKSQERSGGLQSFLKNFDSSTYNDLALYPAPVCHHTEEKYIRIREEHLSTLNGRGTAYHCDYGTPVLQRRKLPIFGLPIWIKGAPKTITARVAIKNPENRGSSADVGEWNVLVRYKPDRTKKPILFLGMKVQEGVHVIRPVTDVFQDALMAIFGKRKKS